MLDLDLLELDLFPADSHSPGSGVRTAAPQTSSLSRKAVLLAGGLVLITIGLAAAAAPIVVAVLIVKAVTK